MTSSNKLLKHSIPIIGFAGFSGSGKTTLLKKIIPILKERGVRVAVIKHAHHQFDTDIPGKDSYEIRHAGAQQMLVASKRRWALVTETPDQQEEPSLAYLLEKIDTRGIDLILVEGFKREGHAKIEVYREGMDVQKLYAQDRNIIAIATDGDSELNTDLPLLDINNPQQICDFIVGRMGK